MLLKGRHSVQLRVSSYSTQTWHENMNASAHNKLKRLQVDFHEKVNIRTATLWLQNDVIASQYTIIPQPWWKNPRGTKHVLTTPAFFYPWEKHNEQCVQPKQRQQNELTYALHSLNNLPACVIQWLCWMYSTFENRFFISSWAYFTRKRKTRQNNTMKKKSCNMKELCGTSATSCRTTWKSYNHL